MGAVPGALVAFRAQSRFGDTVNADTGVLLPINTYSYFPFTTPTDQDVPFTITELNYTQFLSEQLGLNVGKITTMESANEFAGGEGRSQFMNFQLAWSAVLAQLVPYSTLAVSGFWLPSAKVGVTGILMNTTDSSTTTGFSDIGEGTTAVIAIDTQHQWGKLPGGNSFMGVYGFDGDFARIGGLNIGGGDISIETKSESYALLWSGWQYITTEPAPPELLDARDGRQDVQGLGLFIMAGLGDRKTNPVSWSIAGGLSGRGTIPNRDDDTWGIGYFYNELQSLGSLLGSLLEPSVQGFEFYYNIAVAEAVGLTFDVQVADSALLNLDNSVTLAGRLNIRL
jgi:porin